MWPWAWWIVWLILHDDQDFSMRVGCPLLLWCRAPTTSIIGPWPIGDIMKHICPELLKARNTQIPHTYKHLQPPSSSDKTKDSDVLAFLATPSSDLHVLIASFWLTMYNFVHASRKTVFEKVTACCNKSIRNKKWLVIIILYCMPKTVVLEIWMGDIVLKLHVLNITHFFNKSLELRL